MKRLCPDLTQLLHVTFTIWLVAAQVACSSTPKDMDRGNEPEAAMGNAHPAVYEVDSFRMQKWQKRRPATSSDFFFKKCSVMDGKTFWSKTSYDCARL